MDPTLRPLCTSHLCMCVPDPSQASSRAHNIIPGSIGISSPSTLQQGTSRQLQPAIRARHRHVKAL